MVANGIHHNGAADQAIVTITSTKKPVMIIQIIMAMERNADQLIMIHSVSKREMKKSNVVSLTVGLPHHHHLHHHQFTTSFVLSHVPIIIVMLALLTTNVIHVTDLSPQP